MCGLGWTVVSNSLILLRRGLFTSSSFAYVAFNAATSLCRLLTITCTWIMSHSELELERLMLLELERLVLLELERLVLLELERLISSACTLLNSSSEHILLRSTCGVCRIEFWVYIAAFYIWVYPRVTKVHKCCCHELQLTVFFQLFLSPCFSFSAWSLRLSTGLHSQLSFFSYLEEVSWHQQSHHFQDKGWLLLYTALFLQQVICKLVFHIYDLL